MNFTDFTPEQLIGKKVIGYGSRNKQFTSTIVQVAKTTFKIGTLDKDGKVTHKSDSNYYLKDGSLRSGDMFLSGSCRLATDEEIKEFIQNKVKANDFRLLQNEVQNLRDSLSIKSLNEEQLNQLKNLLISFN